MGQCPPSSWIEDFLTPELQTDDCFATGVTRQTLLILRKMCNFNVDFSKIFWVLRPQTHILGRGYGALPQTPPPRRSGASRLRASLGTFGSSIVVSPRPYKNPGNAPEQLSKKFTCLCHLCVDIKLQAV